VLVGAAGGEGGYHGLPALRGVESVDSPGLL